MKFKDQIVFITGASSGIGRAIAVAFARQGAHVASLARSAEKLRELHRQVESLGRRCAYFVGDVRDRAFVFECARRTEQELGAIDVLVNNAGMGVGGAVYQAALEDIQYQMDVNFYGVIHSTHAVLPKMMERGRGMIINISSVAGKASVPYSGFYCASKFALTALSDAWRLELQPFNIHVLNVCPGVTSETEFHFRVRGETNRLPRYYEMTADEVGRRTVGAAASRKREIILTTGGRFYVFANRLAPGLTFLVMSWLVPYLKKKSRE